MCESDMHKLWNLAIKKNLKKTTWKLNKSCIVANFKWISNFSNIKIWATYSVSLYCAINELNGLFAKEKLIKFQVQEIFFSKN